MFSKKNKVDEKKELLKEAYKLGFEVGYYRHYESVGWVRRKREEIESIAVQEGILDKVREAYDRGKVDGERKKSVDLIDERKIADKHKNMPVRELAAIEIPDFQPKFFSVPRFLRKNHK